MVPSVMNDNVIKAFLRRTVSRFIWNHKYRPALWIIVSIVLLAHIFWIAKIYSQIPGKNDDVYETPNGPLPSIQLPGPETFCPPFDPSQDASRPIFFLETSGERCLTPRQLCSVESAARANPGMSVLLYIGVDSGNSRSSFVPKHRADSKGNRRQCDATSLLAQCCPNVRILYGNLIEHLRDTYLWDHWYLAGHFNSSTMPHVHLSDAVRLALLRKFGGIYLDLDVVVLRPLHCLRNTAGYLTQLNNWIENGVLAFEPKHPFIHLYMKLAAKTFKADFRETMGPPALAFAFKLYCNIAQEDRFDHSKAYDCRNGHRLQLQPSDAFYGIGHDESELFFNRHFNDSTVAKLSKSYLTHVYFHTKHKVPLTSLFATLSRQYCPTVYSNALAEDF